MTDMMDTSMADAAAYYAGGGEAGRLDEPIGLIELLRSQEIIRRVLPPAPAVVADIGGGPGRYALWLADQGHQVQHRDIVPLHVEQLRSDVRDRRVTTAVADARELDLPDASVDAVLLLGPLYHLYERADRIRALVEARRIARPGAPVLVSAISRWAPRLHGYLVQRIHHRFSNFADLVPAVEAAGKLPPRAPASFAAYCHRPDELREELTTAGLHVEDLVGVEGIAFALADLAERVADPASLAELLDSARAIERVPELLGLGPHLIATARVPA